MADRHLGRLTRHNYQPQPLRSRTAGFGRWLMACCACLLLGAAGAIAYMQPHEASPCAPCVAEPSDERLRLDLTRAQLALEQEVAARAAVQQTADASAAEARRLSEELRFLRSQAPQPRR